MGLRDLQVVFGVVCLLSVCGGLVVAEEKEYVVTLDHSNFTKIVSKHDFIVVEFYAPWCGHCKQLAPEYEKAASILSKHDPPITLAKLDASDESNRDLAAQFKIGGFPTIKILRNGGNSSQDYKGPRESEGIVTYLKKQLGPASLHINSADIASNHIDLSSIFIVGAFPELSGPEYDNFTKLAEKLRSDYEFGHTTDARLIPLPIGQSSSIEKPTIRLLKPFDELYVDTQDFEIEAIEKFIEVNAVPSVTLFDTTDPKNQPYLMKYFNNENDKALLFLNFSNDKVDVFKSKIQDLATLFRGQGISFLIGDLEPSKPALEFYGIKEEEAPAFLIQKKNNQKFLKYNLEAEQVVPWFKSYLDGKLEPFKKSQPIPETNDEPVKVVVADTLDELVLNSDKNVLLEFYAPWCGHCKNLAPTLDEVAVSYQNDPNVVIAKLDATANDVTNDAFNVQGFPTIYFKTASGNIMEYDSGRAKEDFIKFIEDNRSDAKNGESDDSSKKEVKDDKKSGANADGDKPLKDEL